METVDDAHQPVNGKAFKMRVTDARKFAGFHARLLFRLAYRQSPVVKDANNLRGENTFELFHISIRVIEVSEDLAAASHQGDFFSQCSISLKSFGRASIKSISCFGMVMSSGSFLSPAPV